MPQIGTDAPWIVRIVQSHHAHFVKPPLTDVWAYPHTRLLHGRGVVCSNCYDVPENHMSDSALFHRGVEDAWEEEQREIFDLNRLLDADDPFAEDRAEDLEEADRTIFVTTWRVCQACEEEFEIPEHLAVRFDISEIPLLCPKCLGC